MTVTRESQADERGKPLCARVVYFEIRVRVGLRTLGEDLRTIDKRPGSLREFGVGRVCV